MDFKIGDRVKVITPLHRDIESLVGNYYYIEGIDTRGLGGVPCRIHLKGVTPWVLPEELAPLSVKYTELAAFMYPNGYREGNRWILK